MTYGIIFWGNSSHSIQVFRMQKRQLGLLWGVVTESTILQILKYTIYIPGTLPTYTSLGHI